MTPDLFKINAGVIRDLAAAIAKACPTAFVLIITNPVNSTLPIAVETLKKAGVYNPAKVFGVTTLDIVRGSTFVAQALGDPDPKKYKVPVVGGHSGATILPLFSQAKPAVTLTEKKRDEITYRKMLPWKSAEIRLMLEKVFNLAVMKSFRPRLVLGQPQLVWLMQVSGLCTECPGFT